jgi:type II secretory pathway pseudopilin PulG
MSETDCVRDLSDVHTRLLAGPAHDAERQGSDDSHHRRKRGSSTDTAGFTIIELMVAVSLATVLFVALAALIGTSLRTLAVTRSRGQANEVATEGIEDLQRFNFSSLVSCSTPTVPPGGSVPNGFGSLTTVLAASCTNATFESPCPLPTTSGLSNFPVPQVNYTCARYGINYAVSRYIAWADSSQTIKRLAVVVDWTDQVGHHEVAQQSSVRAPDQAAIIGSLPPALTSASSSPPKVWVNSSGFLVTATGASQNIDLTATATGLTSTDQVNAYFITADPVTGAQATTTIPLTSATGANWLGSIPGAGVSGAPTFPTAGGTQYIGFTAVRKSDGKANSILSSAITFCNNPSPSNLTGACSISANAPSISTVTLNPTTVAISADGSLQTGATLTISVQTSNLYASTSASDSVIAVVETQAGASQVALQPTCSLGSSLSPCNSWAVTIDSTMSLRFAPGYQNVYIVGDQIASATGSTATMQSLQQVDFQ